MTTSAGEGLSFLLGGDTITDGALTKDTADYDMSGGGSGDVLTRQADGSVEFSTPSAATVSVDQYDIVGRISAGSGTASGLDPSILTEETTPGGGDFLLGWESGGALRKFDIADLPYQAEGAILDDLIALGAPTTDGQFIVADGIGSFAYESGATARSSLGLGASDNPHFATIELGSSTDTTISRVSAGQIAVEGTNVAMSGGAFHDGFSDFVANEHVNHASVTLTAGDGLTGGGDITASRSFAVGAGTGIAVAADAVSLSHLGLESLTDPNADRLFFWDDSAGSSAFATIGTGLSMTLTTLATDDSAIVHDDLSGFVANEHIDHSGVTLSAGAGLTGGGDITANRSFAVGAGTGIAVNADDVQISHLGIESLADPGADRLLAWDDTAGATAFIALANITDEASPATGDYVLIYGAEGDFRRTNWSNLPGAGAVDISGTPVATDFARFTDADTLEGRSPAEARADLSLEPGTDVQAFDAGLNSIAGLTTVADRMIYTTAADTYAVATLTSFGRSILDDADAGAVRTTIDAAQTTHTHAASDIVSGTLSHERGGLEADVSGYTGLVGISGGATIEVDTKAELEAQIGDVADFAMADGDTYTGAHNFSGADSLSMPSAAAPTVNATGEFALDTTVTDWSHGIVRLYDGTEELFLVAMPVAALTTPSNGAVPTYNATNDEFEMSVPAGSGDVTAASNFGTDNVVVRADGTGKGVQSSGVSIDDSDNVTGVVGLSATTIDLGNADTTLARAAAGQISVEGTKVAMAGKQTIWKYANSMVPSTTNGAADGLTELATNDVMLETLDFDASTDEYAQFSVALPNSYNNGTVTFRAFWTTSGAVTTGVAWGLQTLARADNEAIDAAWGTATVVTDDAQGAASELLVTAESGTVALSAAAGELSYFRVFRDVSDANDDMTQDAQLIGVQLFYTTDEPTDA